MTYIFLLCGFALAVLLGIIIIPNILLISYKRRLFDLPDERKVHTMPIPRLGGLSFLPVILISICLVIGGFYYAGVPIEEQHLTRQGLCQFMFTTVGAMLLFLVGATDDLIGVSYPYKFLAQLLAAALLILPGEWFNSLGGLLGIYAIPPYAGAAITIFIIIFITNSINLIDGIDGLASGLSSIAFAVLGIKFVFLHEFTFALLAFVTLGVVIPFWFYNVFGNAQRGHKLFMGDAGSLTLGFILSLLVIHLSRTDTGADHTGTPGLIAAFSTLVVPLFDVIRVVLHRLHARKNPFRPDKNHIHHKLLRTGMRVRMVMLTIFGLSIYFIGLNILLTDRIDINWILIIDITSWIAIQTIINYAIRRHKRKSLVKQTA